MVAAGIWGLDWLDVTMSLDGANVVSGAWVDGDASPSLRGLSGWPFHVGTQAGRPHPFSGDSGFPKAQSQNPSNALNAQVQNWASIAPAAFSRVSGQPRCVLGAQVGATQGHEHQGGLVHWGHHGGRGHELGMGRLEWATPVHWSQLTGCGQVALLSQGQLCHLHIGAATGANALHA